MRSFKQILLSAGCFSIVLLLMSYLSSYWWFFDLIASFRLQLAIGTLLISIALGFYKYLIPSIIGVVFGGTSLFLINHRFSNDISCDPESMQITMISANLLSSNIQSDLFLEYINSDFPDILLLLEYTSTWDMTLANRLNEELPYHVKKIQEDNFGISLWSRYPIIGEEIFDITNSYFPMIEAQLSIESDTLTLVGLHLENPVGAGNSQTRRSQIQGLIDKYRSTDNLIVLGDFNMTPYSSDYDELCTELGLRETRTSISPSFPSYFWPLMIPIDHCLIDESFQCSSISTGPNIGSDHLPLEIVLSL